MKPAQLCIAAVVLGVFAALVAAGAMSAKRDESSAPASTIDVRVVERGTRKPVAGATVIGFPTRKPRVEATTDAAGSARLPVVARDEGGRVRVRAEGYETRDSGLGDADAFTVELDPGATAQGVVLEPDGRPIAGAHVFFYRGGDDEDCLAGNYPPLVEATSAADGTFRLPGVRADEATAFTVTAPRHVESRGRWDPASRARAEVRLGPGGRISGVVRGPSGAPVAGAEVSTWPAESANAPRGTPTPDTVTTDAAGRYEIDGVALVGAWTLHASKDGFADAPQVETAIDAAHLDASCDLALRSVAWLEVLVLDPSGAPVTTGRVSYDASSSFAGMDVDADGRCAFEVSRPGGVVVHVDAPCAPPYEQKFECASGETTQCTLRLSAGVTVAGLVVDDLGAPVAGASVEVHGHEKGDGGFFKRVGTSDATGAFRIGGLFPAAYEIVAETSEHERVQVNAVAVPADGLRVVLRRLGRVTMRLRPPAGVKAPKQAWITTQRLDATSAQSTYAYDWKAGVVDVPLAPGRWRVRVEIEGLGLVERECDVAAATETPLGDVAVGR